MNSEKQMIPKTKLEQLVKKIAQSVKKDLRWQPNAILALHSTSEEYLNEVMKNLVLPRIMLYVELFNLKTLT